MANRYLAELEPCAPERNDSDGGPEVYQHGLAALARELERLAAPERHGEVGGLLGPRRPDRVQLPRRIVDRARMSDAGRQRRVLSPTVEASAGSREPSVMTVISAMATSAAPTTSIAAAITVPRMPASRARGSSWTNPKVYPYGVDPICSDWVTCI